MSACYSDLSGRNASAAGGGGRGRGPSGSNVVDGEVCEVVDHFFRSKGLQPPFTIIELSLSASKLSDSKFLPKSDLMAVVYAKRSDGTQEELGRTEVIMNNLNPMWIKKIKFSIRFEEFVQSLIFQVYDVRAKDKKSSNKIVNLKDQHFVGEANCNLSEIMTHGSRSMTLQRHRRNGHGVKSLGSITVDAKETSTSKMAVEMKLRCSNLDKKKLNKFSKRDPFLRISRIVEAERCIPICKTEVVKRNLDPVWKPLCISMQQYASKDNPLVIECFDFNSNGNHTLIGKLQTSIQDIEKLYRSKTGLNFVFPSSRLQANEKILKGKLFVDTYDEKEIHSFLDYISSGFELNLMVAVDFTSSNQDPQEPDSLHYIDHSGSLNPYQQAIMEVGEVIQVFSSRKRFSAWGFGGRFRDNTVSHCFNLNGNAGSSEVENVQGIMAAYEAALHRVFLHRPTLFGPVINQAAEKAAESQRSNSRKYFVLLIITDGVLTDLQDSIEALVRASDLPLSILIAGVGTVDFKDMEILDADNGRQLVSSTGRIATRDIVQFVPMRNVHHGEVSMVQALLEELPGQFLTYMRSRDIKPLNVNVQQFHVPPDPLMT